VCREGTGELGEETQRALGFSQFCFVMWWSGSVNIYIYIFIKVEDLVKGVKRAYGKSSQY